MPFAVRHRTDHVPSMDLLPGLSIRRERSAAAMATVQGRSLTEIQGRFDAGHRAYVASWHDTIAAWGWVATRTASIGEVGSSFVVTPGDRYLWNFVTLPTSRGLGIYPRLLDAIVRVESREAERFWIAYAPENHASGAGIRKAGFTVLVALSFDAEGRAALKELAPGAGRIASRMLGIPEATRDLAPCWRCVRAGRASMSCGPTECQCDYQVPKSGCAA